MSNNPQNASGDQWEQLVVFRLANEYYGVDIAAVNTIIRMQEITEIPGTPGYVDGVVNLRGSIIPVVDLRKRFELPAGEATKASRIIVVDSSGQIIGMIVDAVTETMRIPIDAIEPPSPFIAGAHADYLRGIGKHDDRMVILLDLSKALGSGEEDAKAA